MSDERQVLQHEIDQLRKSLSILYAYSLKIGEHRDTLERQRDRLVDACESGASWIQGNYRAGERPKSLLKELEDAIAEVRKQSRPPMISGGLYTPSASACSAWSQALMARIWRQSLFDRVSRLISGPNTIRG
jgi:hypothetical protein